MNTQTTGNRLTGEHRDLITSLITLAEDDTAFPCSLTIPFNSEHAGDIRRLLERGYVVIRAWDILWPADGSKPRLRNDTGYLLTPSVAAAAERAAAAARERYPDLFGIR